MAAEASEYVEGIAGLLDDPGRADAMGAAARARVLERYSWDARLSQIDRWLPVADDVGKVGAFGRASSLADTAPTERGFAVKSGSQP
jgi:hypothetical protein